MRIEPWTPALAPRDTELVAAIEARRGGALLTLTACCCGRSRWRAAGMCTCALAAGDFVASVLRELAICVVARLTGADYEFHHHAPELKRPGQPMRNWQRSTIRMQQGDKRSIQRVTAQRDPVCNREHA